MARYLHDLHRDIAGLVVMRPVLWMLWPRWLPTIFRTWSFVRREKISVLAVSHVLPMGYVAFFLRLTLGLPYVVFVHGLDVARAGRSAWKRYWLRLIFKHASQVIANSEFTCGLTERAGTKNITVITPCIRELPLIHPPQPLPRRVGSFSPSMGEIKRGWSLLSVGRLVARKNHKLVIEAVAKLKGQFPNIQYVIAGNGPELENLTTQIKKLNLEDHVHIRTNVSDDERAELYEEADIFVLPSYSKGDDIEGFGIVFLEAASYGLPVIAGRGGGVAEAVLDGKTGILIDPDSLDELVAAISKLVTDSSYARELGKFGRDRVAREFTCPSRVEQLRRIYGS